MNTSILILFGSLIIILLIVLFLFIRIKRKKNSKLNPDLSIKVESNDEILCGVKLYNTGKSTAIIKTIEFGGNLHSGEITGKKSIDQVFPIEKTYWVNNTNFGENRDYYLAAGESLYFGKIVKERIAGRTMSYKRVKDIFDQKVNDIKIKIEYENVFGEKQAPYHYN